MKKDNDKKENNLNIEEQNKILLDENIYLNQIIIALKEEISDLKIELTYQNFNCEALEREKKELEILCKKLRNQLFNNQNPPFNKNDNF